MQRGRRPPKLANIAAVYTAPGVQAELAARGAVALSEEIRRQPCHCCERGARCWQGGRRPSTLWQRCRSSSAWHAGQLATKTQPRSSSGPRDQPFARLGATRINTELKSCCIPLSGRS